MLNAFYMTMIKLAGNEQVETEPELEATLYAGRHLDVQPSALLRLGKWPHCIFLSTEAMSSAWIRVWVDLASIRAFDAVANPDDQDRHARAAHSMHTGDGGTDTRYERPCCARPPSWPPASRRGGHDWALAHAMYLRGGIAACQGRLGSRHRAPD